MVAYSFKARFKGPIIAGLVPGPIAAGAKRQTIRADRKRHARPGEDVQLFTGMRTRQCTLLGVARCTAVTPIRLTLAAGEGGVCVGAGPRQTSPGLLDVFARADGFADWAELVAFWGREHPGLGTFSGLLIEWTPKEVAHG